MKKLQTGSIGLRCPTKDTATFLAYTYLSMFNYSTKKYKDPSGRYEEK
jgi:hypothetical protein